MSSSATKSVKVTDVNPHLLCVLCGGYYVDATTIIECLHSFCKSCIVRYLETNKYCPICDVQVHKTKPLLNIRSDRRLQAIVYKLVPGLFQRELNCRKEFYKKYAEPKSNSNETVKELPGESPVYYSDESILVGVQYTTTPPATCHDKRYLRCPAAITIYHLQKLMKAKFSLNASQKVEFIHNGDTLQDNLSLMDLAYMYNWKRKLPVELEYRLLECQQKKIKLFHEGGKVVFEKSKQNVDVFKQDVCLTAHKSSHQPDREVQLQISENGVISVQSIDTNSGSNEVVSMKLDDNKPKTDNALSEEKVQPETMKLIKSLESSVSLSFDSSMSKDKGNGKVSWINTNNTFTTVKETDNTNNNLYLSSKEETSSERKNKHSSNVECADKMSGPPVHQINMPDTSVTIQRVYPGATKDANYSKLVKSTDKPNTTEHSTISNMSSEKNNSKHPNHVKYKTFKSPIKQWNPSIPRSSLIAMKQPQSSSTSKGELEGNTSNKAPKFFKMRNVPRFLGNPASGVKPMYQVATNSDVTTTASQASTSQVSKPSNEITLMKIDPKTLNPIPVVRSSKLPLPPPTSKLQPSFSISPKKTTENHLNDSRTSIRSTSKSSSSPMKTSGKLHTTSLPPNPFILPSPHLMYAGFPRPFSPVDSTSSRMPTDSQIFQAMSMLCSPNTAFHPSLPPSISMLFNPHNTHNRSPQNEKLNLKYSSGDFLKSVPMTTPSVQRVPPSCLTAKVPSSTISQSPSSVKEAISSISSNQGHPHENILMTSVSEKVVNHKEKEAHQDKSNSTAKWENSAKSAQVISPAPLRNSADHDEQRLVEKNLVPLSNGILGVPPGVSPDNTCPAPYVSKRDQINKVPLQNNIREQTNIGESKAGKSDSSILR